MKYEPIFYTAVVCLLYRLSVSVSVLQILSCILIAEIDILLAMLHLALSTRYQTILLTYYINPLSRKRYLSDLKTHFVPRGKHSLPRL